MRPHLLQLAWSCGRTLETTPKSTLKEKSSDKSCASHSRTVIFLSRWVQQMSGSWPYSLPYGLPNQLDCSCNCLLLLQKMETENLLHCNFSSFSFKVKHLILSAINVLFLLFSFQNFLLSTNFVGSTGNWLVNH